MVWSILAVIFVYVWLKKYTFLPEGTFLHYPYFMLGLSYIFFRVLHLLIETGDGGEKRHVGLGAYLLYTLNFTTLVTGPIQRYDAFARDQFASEPIALGPRVIGLQLERIVRGFFKVNVLAMLFHMVQEDALAQMSQSLPLSLKLFSAFRLAVVYPFFLYANFSGYIDIVIALARLMRVRLPENFDRPFSASSFLDFWNRWHLGIRDLWSAAGRRDFDQQTLAVGADARSGPQGVQGAGEESNLYCVWPWPDFQLVCFHPVLVLGQLEADR